MSTIKYQNLYQFHENSKHRKPSTMTTRNRWDNNRRNWVERLYLKRTIYKCMNGKIMWIDMVLLVQPVKEQKMQINFMSFQVSISSPLNNIIVKQIKKQIPFVNETFLFSYLYVCGIYSLYDEQAHMWSCKPKAKKSFIRNFSCKGKKKILPRWSLGLKQHLEWLLHAFADLKFLKSHFPPLLHFVYSEPSWFLTIWQDELVIYFQLISLKFLRIETISILKIT